MTRKTETRRRTPARAPDPAREPAAAAAEPTAVTPSAPEPAFAARFVPAPPERPRPISRRAIFLDVENTSRPQHLSHVIEHLAIDRVDSQTDLVAVANWKVVSQDSARLLARMGAHLVHSAPSTGVRDWSDLRLAVAAGIWLAAARPGDLIEIVSDDRAFDAVGDVAASLGITFRRLSYRRLVKEDVTEIAPPAPRPEPDRESPARRRRRRGGRGRSGAHGPPRTEAGAGRPRARAAHAMPPHAAAEPQTAPHDEVVSVVRELVDASPDRRVTIDALANALKSRGFRRPPGSPRLMTRLRRIREIVMSPSGTIMLADEAPQAASEEPSVAVAESESVPAASAGPDGSASGTEPPPTGSGRRRRRRWRRRGGRRPSAPAAPTA